MVISVDTWRAEVGREVCRAGADLLNDAWGGFDPALAEVAAEYDAALVCTHTDGAAPRTAPHRPSYDDVVASAIEATVALAERAVSLGVHRDSLLIDPAHDFEKNTWHSLELTRRLDEMVATGWPVLVSLSHKDFVGESLDKPVGERLYGPSPPQPSAHGRVPGSTASTRCRRLVRCWRWWPRFAAPASRPASSAAWPEPPSTTVCA